MQIIWTRVTPEKGAGGYKVGWEVARHDSFHNSVKSGTFRTSAARDWTVKARRALLHASKLRCGHCQR